MRRRGPRPGLKAELRPLPYLSAHGATGLRRKWGKEAPGFPSRSTPAIDPHQLFSGSSRGAGFERAGMPGALRISSRPIRGRLSFVRRLYLRSQGSGSAPRPLDKSLLRAGKGGNKGKALWSTEDNPRALFLRVNIGLTDR